MKPYLSAPSVSAEDPSLPPATVLIVESAPLRDIGKVGIPDHSLLKAGTLTADAWRVMKSHSRLGSEAIRNAEEDSERPLPFLACANEIALYHHERWDGAGHPEGLAGEAIPLDPAVVDAFLVEFGRFAEIATRYRDEGGT